MSRKPILLCVLIAHLFSALAAAQEEGRVDPNDLHQLRPPCDTAQLLVKAAEARQRGFQFLVKTQNKDGSWGSHDPKIAKLADFGFQLRNRGSQDAVRTACTAICAEALLGKKDRNEAEEQSLQNAIGELLKVRKFAYHPGESFCTWGYGYKLGFLSALVSAPEGAGIEEEIRQAAQSCVDGLVRFQQHEGGWGYYSGVQQGFDSMSFNTAFFALSLHRAAKMGLKVPPGMVKDAARIVQRQKVPDGSYVYSSSHRKKPSSMLKNLGAGSRTVAAALALHEMGSVSKPNLERSLEVFDNGENYLESGRKLIQPHSAVHQISGYFFFFGYNYATEVATLLGDEVPQQRWDRFAWTMVRTQEKDGCWWDTPAGNYGDKWGTGFALLTLGRFVDETNRRREAAEQKQAAAAIDEVEKDHTIWPIASTATLSVPGFNLGLR
jgi:hypothetical protein